jgi:hypothetical protein
MKNSVFFIKIIDKMIWFLNEKGTYFIAIKPICEALGVNFQEQHKDISNDSILGPRSCKHTILIPGDSQPRKYFCLPEEFIYGWIFSLRPKNPTEEFLIYKEKCYDILFNHFHGSLTMRKNLLIEKSELIERENQLRKELLDNPLYVQLNDLKGKNLSLCKSLKALDEKLINQQLAFPFPSFLS